MFNIGDTFLKNKLNEMDLIIMQSQEYADKIIEKIKICKDINKAFYECGISEKDLLPQDLKRIRQELKKY